MRVSGSAPVATESGAHADGPTDTIGRYLHQVGKRELLSQERELLLGRRIRDGQLATDALVASDRLPPDQRRRLEREVRQGAAARQELVERNLRLVVFVAKRYRRQGVDLADLIQEGNLGLIKAVERFDPEMGYRFSTYATWWIRQAVSQAATSTGATVHVPVHVRTKVRRLRAAQADMGQSLGRAPTGGEVAREIGMDPHAAAAWLSATQPALSLSTLVGDLDTELGELLCSRDDGPENVVAAHTLKAQVRATLDQLPATEARVLALRFGLDGGPPETLSEAAEVIGVSRERVRQIEIRALRRLRQASALALLGTHVA